MNPHGGYLLSRAEGGAATLRSPALAGAGVLHGFGTRLGGVSGGGFASLNFGLKGGDDPDNVRTNEVRLGQTVGFDAQRLFRVRQVHGCRVVIVDAGSRPEAVAALEADALVTAQPGTALGVGTADCVPVLLADARAGVVAAAHAGWRGLRGGVLRAAVAAALDLGATVERLHAAVGPSIGVCCYEVGEDVAAQFQGVPGVVQRGRGPRPHLDLLVAARAELVRAGLVAGPAISTPDGLCTRCQADLFFSYRRDRERTGHHLSVVALPAL